jgi:5-methylcytosine-specific restriction endonuclease McrA
MGNPSRGWPGGSSWKWRKIRLIVLERDQWRCQLKLDGCSWRATEVHHLDGRAVSGDDPDRCVASCRHCNASLGDPSRHSDPDPLPGTPW